MDLCFHPAMALDIFGKDSKIHKLVTHNLAVC